MTDDDAKVIHLVRDGYIPVPAAELEFAEGMIADLKSGVLTGFMLVGVGPETSGAWVGFMGGRMDRIQLLGNLTMAIRRIEDDEMETR